MRGDLFSEFVGHDYWKLHRRGVFNNFLVKGNFDIAIWQPFGARKRDQRMTLMEQTGVDSEPDRRGSLFIVDDVSDRAEAFAAVAHNFTTGEDRVVRLLGAALRNV